MTPRFATCPECGEPIAVDGGTGPSLDGERQPPSINEHYVYVGEHRAGLCVGGGAPLRDGEWFENPALAKAFPDLRPWRDLAYTNAWAAALVAARATDAEAAAVFARHCVELDQRLQRALEINPPPIVIQVPK